MTLSPLRTIPEDIFPEKPLKSKLGRNTYCIGYLKSFKLWSLAMCTVSRKSSKAVPLYQGILSDLSTTLSPFKADNGMQLMSGMPNGVTNCLYSSTILSNTCWSYSTRSILLTAKTTCLMPRRDTR